MSAGPSGAEQLEIRKKGEQARHQEKPQSTTKDRIQAKRSGDGLVITGIRIPFTDLVWLLVQLAVAAIPAGIIVAIVYVFLASILGGLAGG